MNKVGDFHCYSGHSTGGCTPGSRSRLAPFESRCDSIKRRISAESIPTRGVGGQSPPVDGTQKYDFYRAEMSVINTSAGRLHRVRKEMNEGHFGILFWSGGDGDSAPPNLPGQDSGEDRFYFGNYLT